MKRLLLLVALALLGLASPVFSADRVVTKDGQTVEGELLDTGGSEFVDVKVNAHHVRRVRRADVARIESVLTPQQLAATKEGERLLLEASAAKDRPDVRAHALEAFARLDPALVEPLLLKKLGQTSGAPEQRRLAAELLATHHGPEVLHALARAVVLDGVGAVRSSALASLRKCGNAETGRFFVDALLTRTDPSERTRAIAALATFPRTEAVAALLQLGPPGVAGPPVGGGAGSSGNGVSRCHVAELRQSAYISGYQLSAGGTGRVVAEVAVPEVSVLETGCVLEVTARLITEYETFVRGSVFSFLTGTHFQKDEQVAAWWKDAAAGFELAPEAKKQLASLATGD